MEKLPSETVSDILLKLPVDSLSQSRSVCKSWYKSIFDPYFVKKHLQLLASRNKGKSLILLMKKHDNSDCVLHYVEYDDENRYEIIKLNYPPIQCNYKNRVIVGSCNGLICISDRTINDPIYVCNPMTHECVHLPKFTDFPTHSDQEFLSLIMVRGFGYNPSTDQYKVVRILFRQPYTQSFEGQVQVYTLGKDTEWRMKGGAPYFLRWQLSGVLVNGALHWLTEIDDVHNKDCCRKIVAFDLANEEFQVVPSPPCFRPGKNNYDLVELGGYLCVTEYLFDWGINIWKMKDYMGKNSAWTKEYTIGGLCKAFALTQDGEVLLWRNGVILVSYDPKTGTLTNIKDHGRVKRLEAVTHVKSLVSLKAIGEDPIMIRGEMDNKKIIDKRKRKR